MLNDSARPPPLLIGGHRALDFLNSIASPHGTPVEWIVDGGDLLDWLAAAGLIDRVQQRGLASRLEGAHVDAAARGARRLREWFRKLAKTYAGAPLQSLSPRDLRPLNAALAAERLTRDVSVMRPHSERGRTLARFHLLHKPELASPDQLVALVAAEVADFVCHADFTHLRFCEGHKCTVAFYDRSKNHRRRWCDMAVCGNRAKQARHRGSSEVGTV